MKRLVLTLVLVWVMAFLCGAVWAAAGDMGVGTQTLTDGSANYPWLIEDLADFDAFAGNSAYWAAGVHTKLVTDINLSGRTYTTAAIAPDTNSYSAGFQGTQFSGIFDGSNHTISNLTIIVAERDYIALFGSVSNGQINNLGIENTEVEGRDYIGGLVGLLSGLDSRITNCYSMGSVNGTGWFAGGLTGANGYSYMTSTVHIELDGGIISGCHSGSLVDGCGVGGLIGKNSNSGVITSSYATGNVIGSSCWYAGGLVGLNASTITNSYATATVSGTGQYFGGLVGFSNSGTILSCYAAGAVSGGSYLGGLIGKRHQGTVTGCFSTGDVSGKGSYIGGLIGQNYSNTLTSCYATGAVSGSSYVGGLVGYSDGVISFCYATGQVISNTSDAGGLTGCCSQRVNSSFWDVQLSGQTDSRGGKGLTTQQMKSMSVYQNAGWAGSGWIMDDGNDTPRLAWEGVIGVSIPEALPIPLLGNGTVESPYQVWTAEDFEILSWHSSILNKHIQLMMDLNLDAINLYPIGDLGRFSGVFDGQCFVIHNLTINQANSEYIGLFSYLTNGQIKNLNLRNSNIQGGSFVGGMAGYLTSSSITGCSVEGVVQTTGSSAGGLVGSNQSGLISACYTTGTVAGQSDVGGIVGGNNGTISCSYATCDVNGDSYVGGLAGWNNRGTGNISYSYSTGHVTGSSVFGGLIGGNTGIIEFCFWDTETSCLTTSGGGTGKTTVEMMTESTFTGWDFSDSDGAVADWMMLREGEDYPRLAWQAVWGGDVAGLYGVDMVDFVYLANYWGLDCGAGDCGRADIDGSGDVGIGDLVSVAEEWLVGG